ncbi:MAG: phosphotransferase [Micrococcales bacterium]
MGKSPLILAALAADAVRNLKIVHAAGHSNDGEGRYDSAILTDDQGAHYIARIPTSPSAGTDLEVEMRVLRTLGGLAHKLPFEIPVALGETRSNLGERVVVFKLVYGNQIDSTRVAANGTLAHSIAAALAAIHSVNPDVVVAGGFSAYSVAENLRLRVAELDRAAQTGKVPAILLSRWEAALEDSTLWRYQPSVIHGELSGLNIFETSGEVSGIVDWYRLELNDPAMDLSWLVPDVDHELLDAVVFNYQLARNTGDTRIAQRAVFYAEFAHLQYLLHGVTMRDENAVDAALFTLNGLAEQAQDGLLAPLTDAQAQALLTPVADVIDFTERTTGSMPIISDSAVPSFLTEEQPTAFAPSATETVSTDTDQMYFTGGDNYDDDSTAPIDRP